MSDLYKLGATVNTMVYSSTVFGSPPESFPIPGGKRVSTLAGTKVYVGKQRSLWHYGFVTLEQITLGLAHCCSTLATGTLAGSHSDLTITGTNTAFVVELQVSDRIAVHLGLGIYELLTVASITDATHFEATSLPTQTFSTVGFRYRRSTTFSGDCFIITRDFGDNQDNSDSYFTWSAVANFPDIEKLGSRWSPKKKYKDFQIEFILKAIQ